MVKISQSLIKRVSTTTTKILLKRYEWYRYKADVTKTRNGNSTNGQMQGLISNSEMICYTGYLHFQDQWDFEIWETSWYDVIRVHNHATSSEIDAPTFWIQAASASSRNSIHPNCISSCHPPNQHWCNKLWYLYKTINLFICERNQRSLFPLDIFPLEIGATIQCNAILSVMTKCQFWQKLLLLSWTQRGFFARYVSVWCIYFNLKAQNPVDVCRSLQQISWWAVTKADTQNFYPILTFTCLCTIMEVSCLMLKSYWVSWLKLLDKMLKIQNFDVCRYLQQLSWWGVTTSRDK